MLLKKYLSVVLFGALLFCVVPQNSFSQSQASRKPRIAIGNFEYKGVMHLEDGTWSFVDMISTALIKTRRFKLVERNRVNEALNEMGLGEAGVVDPADCQKLGTLLKADLILFGTITQASLDEKAVSISGLNTVRQDVRMSVDLRIVDAKTGEIKSAETISKKKTGSKSVHIAGSVSTGGSSSGIVGDVMRDIANGVVEKLVTGIYPISIEFVRDDGSVKLNYGESLVELNTVYKVYDADGFVAGKIRVTDVQSRNSLGKIISGSVEIGMTCKKASGAAAAPAAKVQEIPW